LKTALTNRKTEVTLVKAKDSAINSSQAWSVAKGGPPPPAVENNT
jgi:hypothetical protein